MLRATAETAAEDPRAFVINLWGELYSQQRLNKGLAQRLLGIDAVEEATSLSVPFDVGSLLGELERVAPARRHVDRRAV